VNEVLPDADRWNESGDEVVVATVVDVPRSAPRVDGAKDPSGAA
jgi:xanthine/CO dehydrogenase XdhC/CoxF family maturation factor